MSGTRFALMGSTSLTRRGGAGYRPSIRLGKHGHPMRDPDGHDDADPFAELNEKGGEVEVGKPADGIETNQPEKQAAPAKPAKPAAKAPAKAAAKPAAATKPAAAAAEKAKGVGEPGEGDEDEGTEGAEGDEDEIDEEEEVPKPKPKASERIQELNKRLRQSERLRLADANRLDAFEAALKNGGLPGGAGGGNSPAIGEAPDPRDTEKYPLGHLDDRYIEDKLEWLAESKAAARADAVLQRQQGDEQQRQAEVAHAALLEKVDDLSTRGSEQYDDFQEAVVESGMRGDWRLDQPTFEAAHEAEHGAQILYELSQDKAEAKRVAALSPYGQTKFVLERDAEIGAGKQPRKIPRAGAPPETTTKGANSRTRIDPATSDLRAFEKAWLADEKGG